MNLPEIKIPDGGKIAFIGDIHEHEEQFDQLIAKIKPGPKMLFVSVGDIYDKGFGVKVAESITNKIKKIVEEGYGYVIRGNHELKAIQLARAANEMTPELTWLDQQPLAQTFIFENQSRITVVHGGVLPTHTWDDLNNIVETSYVRSIGPDGKMIKMLRVKQPNGKTLMQLERTDGKIWHELYDGRFGYIVSGHNAQKDGIPKFWNYSCNLDSACYATGTMTAQIFSDAGREQLLMVSGLARKPDLELPA